MIAKGQPYDHPIFLTLFVYLAYLSCFLGVKCLKEDKDDDREVMPF